MYGRSAARSLVSQRCKIRLRVSAAELWVKMRAVSATALALTLLGIPQTARADGCTVLLCLAGNWRNMFTAHDRQVFKEIAGDLLVKWNYEQDLSW